MLRYARDRDVIISAILEISTHKAEPDVGSEDERRYVRYAVAPLPFCLRIQSWSAS